MLPPVGRRRTPADRGETLLHPRLLGIGDSLVAGHPACFSRLESGTRPGPNLTQAAARRKHWTWLNQGIGSQTTTQIAARFTVHVINLGPQVALINGGINDIAGGSQSTFINNWTAMLDACQTAGIRAVALLILPWTNGTNTQLQTRDTWNAALVSLVGGYPGFLSVDASSLVGKFRAGGDVNNLWDIQPAFAAGDGVHFNPAGYDLIGAAIAAGL